MKAPIKKVCLYSERTKRLHSLIVQRAIDKTNINDAEIDKLQSQIDCFEWGIK